MKHLFTLSLVFFSLTHLAQAQRMEGVTITEKYCSEELARVASAGTEMLEENSRVQFLSSRDLSRLGILAQAGQLQRPLGTPPYLHCVCTATPQNNSP